MLQWTISTICCYDVLIVLYIVKSFYGGYSLSINLAVARNIKHIREQKKLTLDAAAQVTGVSRSMLAQIEKGDANPTVSVLWKIANGYKVAFTSLVEEKNAMTTVVRAENITAITAGDGKYLNYPVFCFDEQHAFEVYRIVILVGGTLEAKAHLLGTEEYITVFSGSVAVSVQDKVYNLHTGDSIRFLADVAHSYTNIGQEDVSLSMILYYPK